MYEELVMRLREAPNDWPDKDLHYEAADAIEELNGMLNQLEDGCLYVKKDGVLYKSQRIVPNGCKSITLPKIEFEMLVFRLAWHR